MNSKAERLAVLADSFCQRGIVSSSPFTPRPSGAITKAPDLRVVELYSNAFRIVSLSEPERLAGFGTAIAVFACAKTHACCAYLLLQFSAAACLVKLKRCCCSTPEELVKNHQVDEFSMRGHVAAAAADKTRSV